MNWATISVRSTGALYFLYKQGNADDTREQTITVIITSFFLLLLTHTRRDLDFINILSYDYHVASEPQVNHHAPLRARSDFEDVFDPNEELNIVRERLLLLSLTLKKKHKTSTTSVSLSFSLRFGFSFYEKFRTRPFRFIYLRGQRPTNSSWVFRPTVDLLNWPAKM